MLIEGEARNNGLLDDRLPRRWSRNGGRSGSRPRWQYADMDRSNFRLVDMDRDREICDAYSAGFSTIRIVSRFIQLRPIQRLLSRGTPSTLRVRTRFNLDEVAEGVNDLAALLLLLDRGAEIKGVRHLHSKMYLLGEGCAIVTSANPTDTALLRNHEFGFRSTHRRVVALWRRAASTLTRFSPARARPSRSHG